MTESRFLDPEDEAFNEIERRSNAKKDVVRATMRVIEEQKIMHKRGIGFLKPKSQEEFYDELRNGVIEEVARHIEKLTGFGQDTVSSLAIYIREMKK
jgi:predicted transcriptional regulator